MRKWLCYFTTIALVSQVEFVTSWLPGYYLFKFVGVLYLVLPQFNGIETVYTKFVEPFLVQHEKTIDDVLEKARAAGAEKMTELSAKVMSAVASTATQSCIAKKSSGSPSRQWEYEASHPTVAGFHPASEPWRIGHWWWPGWTAAYSAGSTTRLSSRCVQTRAPALAIQ